LASLTAAVASLRRQKTKADEDVAAAREDWEQQNVLLLERQKLYGEDLARAEQRLRHLTIEEYARTGNKHPAPGLGIQLVTRLEYDVKEAFGWAIQHVLCLQLDKKAFEKLVKVAPLPFVEAREEAQATIAEDLENIRPAYWKEEDGEYNEH